MLNPDFNKYPDGLMPVIIQDHITQKVLMLGFMSAGALVKTHEERKVIFYSRSKQRLWMKGETSGNILEVKEILIDCDNDTLLIKVVPTGPVCHKGPDTCFKEDNSPFTLQKLEQLIADRRLNPVDGSYTSSLFAKGINKIAQKVGEEAVELVIESKDDSREKFLGEAADLLYHYLILLHARNFSFDDVVKVLGVRHKK